MKNILVVGYPDRIEEFKSLKIKNAKVQFINQMEVDQNRMMMELGMEEQEDDDFGFFDSPLPEDVFGDIDFELIDVVFDLNLDENPENLEDYMEFENLAIFGCAVKRSLSQMMFEHDADELLAKFFGINSWPSFIARSRMEVSMFRPEEHIFLGNLMSELGLEFDVVADRVGMVTPRVISMIVNEACFVLGEGTADIEAVDRAMKLGTAYPHGPFEWADKIGLYNIVQVLEYMRIETGQEKFRVAPLLKDYFRRSKNFYSAS